MDEKQSDVKRTAAVHRSPSYPAVTLATAVDRARVFYEHERRNAANVAVAVGHWGYAASSGGGRTLLAALIAFGLLRDEGSGDKRQVRLTDLAYRIILDDRPESSERSAALREAALTPRIYREILDRFPRLEVSDANLKHYLLVERKFNDNAVKDFIKDLRSTAAFAKLEAEPDNPIRQEPALNVGDYVQWESGGVVQFEARRVTWVKDEYAGVDGSSTGLPIAELKVVPAPAAVVTPLATANVVLPQPQRGTAHPVSKGNGMRQEVFALAEGDVTIQWPERLSPESLQDFTDWLRILERKVKRAATTVEPPKSPPDSDGA